MNRAKEKTLITGTVTKETERKERVCRDKKNGEKRHFIDQIKNKDKRKETHTNNS